MVNLYSAHMDPDDWQQPQQFHPERFLDQSDNVINRHRVIAFSLGIYTLLTFSAVMSSVWYPIINTNNHLNIRDVSSPTAHSYVAIFEFDLTTDHSMMRWKFGDDIYNRSWSYRVEKHPDKHIGSPQTDSAENNATVATGIDICLPSYECWCSAIETT